MQNENCYTTTKPIEPEVWNGQLSCPKCKTLLGNAIDMVFLSNPEMVCKGCGQSLDLRKNNSIQIGQIVKKRRKELGITLDELGKKVSLDKSTIQRYEKGQIKKIKLPILEALLKELEIEKHTSELNVSKNNKNLPIKRTWAMPNKNTFEIKPIRELIDEELTEGLWIDPFAGNSKIATVTNDLNKSIDTDFHMDALDFLKKFDDNSVDGVLYDPPYSPRQVSECYHNFGLNVTQETTRASFWGNHKKEIARILKPNGKVITFGWNSGGIGQKYGFDMKRILLVAHGGWHNDTICTVEVKNK